CFFFSSRRRHTRFSRDWSSDVCSSDLEQHGFSVDATDDPTVFTDENLKKYDALVFSNTNNDVFDTDAQRVALMRYIQAGGGFVGDRKSVVEGKSVERGGRRRGDGNGDG